MSSTIDKLKDKLHIRRKSQDITGAGEPHAHASDGTFGEDNTKKWLAAPTSLAMHMFNVLGVMIQERETPMLLMVFSAERYLPSTHT